MEERRDDGTRNGRHVVSVACHTSSYDAGRGVVAWCGDGQSEGERKKEFFEGDNRNRPEQGVRSDESDDSGARKEKQQSRQQTNEYQTPTHPRLCRYADPHLLSDP